MKTATWMTLIGAWALIALGSESPAAQQQDESRPGDTGPAQLGGASSVAGTLRRDHAALGRALRFDRVSRVLDGYSTFKTRVAEEWGLTFGADYNALFQTATDSLGEDSAASGVIRFFGRWEFLGRGSPVPGTFVYKVENRHRLGTDIAPQDLGFEVGYAGLTAVPFSDAGWLLSNFFWEQGLWDGRLAFLAGVVDVTDYVGTYSLVDPWSDFANLAFSTDPTIPAPNQGLGAAACAMVTHQIYMHGGLADANGDPTDPGDSFDSFFGDAEYFSHVEIGWVPSRKSRYDDNIHLTAWHADAREVAQVPDGWGLALSANRLFADQWEPFARAGYAEDGGALWKRSVSLGLGYHTPRDGDLIGLGLSWGDPAGDADGTALQDQYTVELFYRLRFLERLTITPDVQILFDPALNPEEHVIAVFGIRARINL